jgi:hypothetical protein
MVNPRERSWSEQDAAALTAVVSRASTGHPGADGRLARNVGGIPTVTDGVVAADVGGRGGGGVEAGGTQARRARSPPFENLHA